MSGEYSLNKTKFLNQSEMAHLETLLDKTLDKGEFNIDFRNALILKLLVCTGARVTEVLNLTKLDLNLEDNSILIHGLKGSRDREIPLPKRVFLFLREYSNTVMTSEKIFPINYDTLHSAWKFYRPSKINKLHGLRHTAALKLYEKTKDIRLTGFLLGHKAMANTQIYVNYQYNNSQLKKALDIK